MSIPNLGFFRQACINWVYFVLQIPNAFRLNFNDLKERADTAEEVRKPGRSLDLDFMQYGFGASMLPSECKLYSEAPTIKNNVSLSTP